MKRIIIIVLLLFCLAKCSTSINVIKTYTPNMDGYVELDDSSVFVGISVDNLVSAFDDNKSMIVYIGNDLSPDCQEMINTLSQVALDMNAKVYYLDTNSDKYPVQGSKKELLKKELSGVLMTNAKNQKELYIPHVFSLKDGKIVRSMVGLPDDHNNLYNEYYKLFKDIYAK